MKIYQLKTNKISHKSLVTPYLYGGGGFPWAVFLLLALLFGNNLYSQTSSNRLIIGNITIEEGEVFLRARAPAVTTIVDLDDVDNLRQEQIDATKKLIITGTSFSSEDLVAMRKLNEKLPKLEAIELKNVVEVPEWLGSSYTENNWLKSFSAPKATKIGEYVFCLCIALEEINLPEAVNIGDNAFRACDALEKVYLPKAKSIGGHAFQNCDVLTEINLPEATNIGSFAFGNCKALKKLTLGGARITVDPTAFVINDSDTAAHLLKMDLYLSASEMQSGSVAGNTWTKDGASWTFKSITRAQAGIPLHP